MSEHKWADVLRGMADGKQAQFVNHYLNGNPVWLDSYAQCNPISCPHFQWRIKPEPKPDVVWFTQMFLGGLSHESSQYKFTGANLRVVFDGETGKLKSAEVLP